MIGYFNHTVNAAVTNIPTATFPSKVPSNFSNDAGDVNLSGNEDRSYSSDAQFSNINLSGNGSVIVNANAFIRNGVNGSGNGELKVTGDAYFRSVINISGQGKDGNAIHVFGDAFFNSGINISGNTNITLEKDMYVYGSNFNHTFNGAKSRVCVEGNLYYSDKMPTYINEPCPTNKNENGKGIYVRGQVKKIGETQDTIPPSLLVHGVENIRQTSADIWVSSNETGKVFYLTKLKTQSAPSLTEIKNGNLISVTKDVQSLINLTSLTANTDYAVYMVAEDLAGNTSTVQKGDFKTISTSSEVSLNFSVTPTQPDGYLIDQESGYAETGINATIIPSGTLGDEARRTPIDVVFIFDTSGSMVLDMECYDKKGNVSKCRDNDKLIAAKNGAYKAITEFSEKAVAGDRFALVPFAGQVNTWVPFNTSTAVADVKAQLEAIKTTISTLNANGGTNYFAALSKANELFGNSSNPKYIVFLTDGRPDTDAKSGNNSNYPSVNVNGDFQKWEKVTKEVSVRECKWFKCNWVTKTINDWDWSTTKYPVHANVSLRIDNNIATFNYQNEKYLYVKGYDDLDYVYAMAAASNLASKGIKLLSIGFGTSGDVDLNFLSSLSNLTGATAQLGSKANISTIFEDVSNKVNKLALRNIKVKVKIKDTSFLGSVGLGENAVLDSNDPNYAIINFEDIQFEKGQTPNSKIFTFTFDRPGSYTFSDVKLTYTDLSNNQRTVEGAPFNVLILENKSASIKFKDPMYDIDVYNDESSLDLTNEVVPVLEDGELPEKLIWSSSNTQIATIINGIVYPKGVGTTVITVASQDDPSIVATVEVKVNLKSISFKFKNYEYTTGMDMTKELVFKPNGFNVPLEAIEWTTNNASLNVNNGVLTQTGSLGGYVIVTAKLKNAYKIDTSEKVEGTTLVKVNPRKDDTNVNDPKKEW